MSQNPEKEKNLKRLVFSDFSGEPLFSREYQIKIVEKRTRTYPFSETVAYINGEAVTLDKADSYNEITKRLWRKMDVLEYVSDETFYNMKKEILLEITRLLYKLEKGDRE